MATGTQQGSTTPPRLIFWFDIVCPYAYLASQRLEELGKFSGAEVSWVPVSLGGLYRLSEAPHGAGGSASDSHNSAKALVLAADFQRECQRNQLKLEFHPRHPLKTIDASRLICAFPEQYRPALSLALYKAYWVDHVDIESRETLLRIARSLRIPDSDVSLDEALFLDSEFHTALRNNTKEAFEHGAFGVPSFWIPEAPARDGNGKGKMFFGQDRMHLVEAELLALRLGKPLQEVAHLERLLPRCLRTPPEERKRTLTFWYDISSPWSYIGWTQLERIQRETGDALTIVTKPFVLGALFKHIGSPMVPMEKFSHLQRVYTKCDLYDWDRFWSAVNAQEYPPLPPVNCVWPDVFPINSINAARVVLIKPETLSALFLAAWSHNREIGKPEVLAQVLSEAGFDGARLLKQAKEDENVKKQLRENTEQAIALGFCGAPTFQIGKHIIWGQDRLNVVQDLIAGWRPSTSHLKAKVGAFPFYDYRM